jgi:hypothetical protein
MPLIIPSNSQSATGYTIDQSIRFNSADSAYMSRTPSSAGNRKTFTVSLWLKRGNLAANMNMFGPQTNNTGSGTYGSFRFENSQDRLEIQDYSNGTYNWYYSTSPRTFRDPSAWYHLVASLDTTNAIASERIKVYINGQREVGWSGNDGYYPTLNYEGQWNNTLSHEIGAIQRGSTNQYFDGYLAEIVFIDGQALDSSSFGEYNSSNIWVPKDVSGLTFGTNGFYIDGRDSADLGDDESGNGNDFTSYGLAAHDQVPDSPTNNFATINSVYADVTGANVVTLTEGNLKAAGTSSSFDIKGMTFNVPKSGKWYMEYTIGGGYDGFGFCVVGQEGTITPGGNGLGQLSVAQGGGIQYNGWRNGASVTVNMGTFTSGHIHQVAIDVDNGKFYYGIQNTYYAADAGTDGNPSAGTNHTSTFDFAGNDVVLMTAVTTDSNPEHWNFGQNGTFNGTVTAQGNSDGGGVGNFYYAVPTGYKALCTKNLGAD